MSTTTTATSPSPLKPIKVYGKGGPNPIKVSIVLSELNIPYEHEFVPFSEVKNPEFLAINPNGRLPAIHDPNTGLTLWESGAIIEYLIERYDSKDHKLSFPAGSDESFLTKQWLFFQSTGQGPYYGQIIWFKKYHPEQVPSAVKRYVDEMNRVTGVLEGWLQKQNLEYSSGGNEKNGGDNDGPWLVGNKLTYADLAFVPWQALIMKALSVEECDLDKFPLVKEWLRKLTGRETVKGVIEASS